MNVLWWLCPACGEREPVEPTGNGEEYGLGDREPCITCENEYGTARVVTPEMIELYDLGRVRGLAELRSEQPTQAEIEAHDGAWLFVTLYTTEVVYASKETVGDWVLVDHTPVYVHQEGLWCPCNTIFQAVAWPEVKN